MEESKIYGALKKFFGFDSFKGRQFEVVNALLDGKNCFVLMPTGGGKSLCYQLPALLLEGTAVVVSPLIALMKNQVDAIRGFIDGDDGIAHFLNSSLNKQQIQDVREDLIEGRTKILYVAPESLKSEENIEFLHRIKVSFYAIDEAHCISEWGHDFRPDYSELRSIMNAIGKAPVIALTATATPKVQSDIKKSLGIEDCTIFKTSFDRPNLYYEIREKGKDIDHQIVKFLQETDPNTGIARKNESGIVYCLSRKKVEEVASILNVNGISALPYHAGFGSAERSRNQDAFLNEKVSVMVATIAFGMGIDKPDIRYVIHYNTPKSIEGYYQETGRAGRDGKPSTCIGFYKRGDIEKLKKFMQKKTIAEQEIGNQLLGETMAFSETNLCRRKMLLNYFGEKYDKDNCGNCDNCLHPKQHFEGQKEMTWLLTLIDSLAERFKIDHIAAILAGKNDTLIKSYRHDKLEMFGKGADHDENFWASVIYQGIVLHLIDKNTESYGLLSVSEKGHEFLEHPYPLTLYYERKYRNSDDDDDIDDDDETTQCAKALANGGGAADEQLLSLLKGLRSDMAKKKNVQWWAIFSDASLDDMTIMLPSTLEELVNCQGVGVGKSHKYGQPFVDLINKYVDENDIERPDNFIMKTPPAPGNEKLAILNLIDRHTPIEDIARDRGMSIDEVLDNIERIAYAGNKLNIDYAIKESLDQESIDELWRYFSEEASDDSMQNARDALGDYYEDWEIRLVRIKYICEVAN